MKMSGASGEREALARRRCGGGKCRARERESRRECDGGGTSEGG